MKRQAKIDKKTALNRLADEFESTMKEIVETVSSAANELQAMAQSTAGTADGSQRADDCVGRRVEGGVEQCAYRRSGDGGAFRVSQRDRPAD